MAKKKKKKSWGKRLAKAAAIAAAAYGASKMFGGRNKGNVLNTAAMEDANINTNAPILGTDHIKKAPAAVVADTAVTNVRRPPIGKMHGAGTDAEAIIAQNKRADYANKMKFRGNLVPPSMRGVAKYAEGASTYMPPNRQWPGGHVTGTFKKGGRVKKAKVTGIAKRGFGRALMKGKK